MFKTEIKSIDFKLERFCYNLINQWDVILISLDCFGKLFIRYLSKNASHSDEILFQEIGEFLKID